jgi:pteridine reductase
MTAITLAGKAALVTGGGKRVGRAIALALGKAGMRVAVHYLSSADEAEDTCRLIRESGGDAFALRADLSSRSATRGLVDAAIAQLGGLDVLVPSAAGYERIALDDIADDDWDRMLELDLTSPFVLAQHAIPALRASRGSITFITCSSATTPFRHHLPYTVAKAGVRHLARTLALELAPDVRVNAVAPGTVLPPPDMSAVETERIRSRIPLGRLGAPEDIAEAVVYLSRAPFVTGHEIHVDGGRTVAAIERFGGGS